MRRIDFRHGFLPVMVAKAKLSSRRVPGRAGKEARIPSRVAVLGVLSPFLAGASTEPTVRVRAPTRPSTGWTRRLEGRTRPSTRSTRAVETTTETSTCRLRRVHRDVGSSTRMTRRVEMRTSRATRPDARATRIAGASARPASRVDFPDERATLLAILVARPAERLARPVIRGEDPRRIETRIAVRASMLVVASNFVRRPGRAHRRPVSRRAGRDTDLAGSAARVDEVFARSVEPSPLRGEGSCLAALLIDEP